MELYREIILDHYRNPRGWGTLKKPTAEAQGYNELCGDQLNMQVLVENGIIKTMVFTGHGCAISLATASLLSEVIGGKEISTVQKLSSEDIQELLGTRLPPTRLKCGLLPLETIQLACAKLK